LQVRLYPHGRPPLIIIGAKADIPDAQAFIDTGNAFGDSALLDFDDMSPRTGRKVQSTLQAAMIRVVTVTAEVPREKKRRGYLCWR
jgi:hypothetical protein